MFNRSRLARPAHAHTPRFAPALRIAPVLAAALLGGCSTASYPTLAQRPGETLSAARPASAPAPGIAPATADLSRQLAGWAADARAANARFIAARPAAEAALAAARGSRRDSEAWSTASLALAELERARSNVGEAQAAVEAVYTEDRLSHATQEGPTPRPSATLIDATRDAITAISDAQDKTLKALRARLPD